ncbi:hypothetical protein [Lyngbya sp. CCY1209]|uniref:hypothetical protein n=1 Tax=Lyngbya sp. CCY1209 TaxID=2886103 RepID=UPI002D200E40|nr:hypothetical protein [Lyngbya sp. CCY1209]MEB3885450.1 hypothetical protein [Lyngbya sp. CCY1209]
MQSKGNLIVGRSGKFFSPTAIARSPDCYSNRQGSRDIRKSGNLPIMDSQALLIAET